MTRKEQLEHSIIYTPCNEEERQRAIKALERARELDDIAFIPMYLQQIIQANEYAALC